MQTYSNLRSRLIVNEIWMGLIFGTILTLQAVIFLEKGIPFWQLGYVLGIIPLATAVFEVPFGALADRFGRIRTFKLSRFVYIVSILMLFFFETIVPLLISSLLLGIANALSSGTYSAWYVERLNEVGDGDKTEKLTGQIQASMATGLMLGALIGGQVPELAGDRFGVSGSEWSILACLILSIAHLIASNAIFGPDPEPGLTTNVKKREESTINFLRTAMVNPVVRELLTVGLFAGFLIAACDTYWQPRLIEIEGSTSYSGFGWITFGYFFMAVIGPLGIGFVADVFKISTIQQVRSIPVITALILIFLSTADTSLKFLTGYFGFMFVFSMINPAAFTLLNNSISDEIRSTMQSIFSLVFTLGAALSAFGLPYLFKSIGISSSWLIIGASVGAILSLLVLLHSRSRRETSLASNAGRN